MTILNKIFSVTCIIILLFFCACRTKKNIINTSAVAVDTATAVLPVDTSLNHTINAENNYVPPSKTTLDYCNNAYFEIEKMLDRKSVLSFKKAVFVTENAFLEEKISEIKFNLAIDGLKSLCGNMQHLFKIENYKGQDSINFTLNGIIFNLMSDTLRVYSHDKEYYHLPYTYDFDDFFGKNYWDKTFVINLLTDNTGTCRSLPYLYKIIADEIGAKCWLSLAPQHVYIKNYSKQLGWYNTELTSKEFPTEGWVMASGYITLEAIQNGIFMDTIGTKQAVALCLVDLANGYNRKIKNNDGTFVLKCCELSLKHFPTNINAMLLKAETLKEIYLKNKESEKGDNVYKEMLDLYMKIHKFGYREMPEEMYIEWIKTLQTQKDKFINKKISETFKNTKK